MKKLALLFCFVCISSQFQAQILNKKDLKTYEG
jgi:hypothetical protein